jgi:hypothetical protein
MPSGSSSLSGDPSRFLIALDAANCANDVALNLSLKLMERSSSVLRQLVHLQRSVHGTFA